MSAIIYINVQTTGSDVNLDEILSIAAIGPNENFSCLVNTAEPITTTSIHGLSHDHFGALVRGQTKIPPEEISTLRDALVRFFAFVDRQRVCTGEKVIVVFHCESLPYKSSFLARGVIRCGIKLDMIFLRSTFFVVSSKIAEQEFPYLTSKYRCNMFWELLPLPVSAMDGAESCARMVGKMANMLNVTAEELVRRSLVMLSFAEVMVHVTGGTVEQYK